ncbi:polysaccharide biosynthesis/export protein [Sphingomonas sp. F9_3S_D5_B_2]
MLRISGLLLILSLAATAPASVGAQSVGPVQPISIPTDLTGPRADAAITPLDRLAISVFREPDLSAEDVPVDESGRIALPLIGSVMAAGKSTDVLALDIAAKLKAYVRQPEVAVLVKQAASRKVTVTGSVMQPGVYPLEGRLTLLQAVALARGPSQVAALDQALIFRIRDGQRVAARFNLDTIAKGKSPDPEVISGDTVAVGSSKTKTAWRDIVTSLHSFNIFNVIP